MQWRVPWREFVREGSSWRTSPACSLWTEDELSSESSVTWPRWATWDGTALYELPTPALPTDEPESSSLLPTPLSADGGGPRGSSAGWGLRDVSRTLLPTPTSEKAGNDMTLTCSGDGREKPNKLGWAIALLPTPDAYQGTRGGSQHPDKRQAGGHSVSLQDVAEHLLPTPTSRDYKGPN